MSLTDVRGASTSRLREVGHYLALIEGVSPKKPGPVKHSVKAAKGLFFVHLYAVLEFTVVSAVQKTIQVINTSGKTVKDVKPIFLSLALDPECKAVADVGPSKLWPKRRVMFAKVGSTDPLTIDESLFPADGSNIKYEQLASVWETFCISAPVVPRIQLRVRLQELTENRNAVSHGRESPITVGGRYSPADLQDRFKEVGELCNYIVDTLEQYLVAAEYLA